MVKCCNAYRSGAKHYLLLQDQLHELNSAALSVSPYRRRGDSIPQVQPELDHATIGALARTVNEYEFVLHPGDFAYADDWYETPSKYIEVPEASSVT
jgi:hypothetical protein